MEDPGNIASILTMRDAERRAAKLGKQLHVEYRGLWWPVISISVQGPVVMVVTDAGAMPVRPSVGANFDIR